MKKNALQFASQIALICLLGFNMVLMAQPCVNNPAIVLGDISPAPLNTNTGVLSFTYIDSLGNPYSGWQTDPVVITMCFLNIAPQNGVASLGGNFYQSFNWIYDPGSNCMQGTQNQTIPPGIVGLVTVDFFVTNSIACPNNQLGANINVQPAACMNGINETVDDTESVYTCSVGGAGCSFGQININSTLGSVGVGYSVSTPPPPVATYLWDFGDGYTSTAPAGTHYYTSWGTHIGTLTVNDGSGPCMDTFTVTLIDTTGACINNPSVQQGDIYTMPLTSDQGILRFTYFANLLDYADWQTDPITLTLCLSNVTPQNGSSSVGGIFSPFFNWSYDIGTNCLTGTQNQTIIGATGGEIRLDFDADTTIVCPNNQLGFDVVIGIPACMSSFNDTTDDMESIYTCYDTGACSFGTVNVNTTLGSLTADFSVPLSPPGGTYLWDFGDGNSSTAVAPSHTYATAGTYNGSVVVTDSTGTPCIDSFSVTLSSACINNPSVQQGSISPAPINSNNGVLQFSFFENLLDYSGWQSDPVTITLCLLNISPIDSVNSVGGSYHQTFDWTYDPGSNCLQGTQNQTIFGGTGGLITVDFEVTNVIPCPLLQMGFNVNLQGAACMNGTNLTADDTESVYTCFDSTGTNCQGALQSTLNGSDFDFSLTGTPNPILYYSWDFGDGNVSGDPAPTHSYAQNGTYLVRLVSIDSLLNQCTYTMLVTYNGSNLCIDAGLIDLTHVCTTVYAPVCGCNNVTYDNACIAEKCFGVASMTSGPCSTSSDSTCTTVASYQYTDVQGPAGHEVFFVAMGSGVAPLNYYWDFGDGTSGFGANPIHIYSDTTSLDSIQAFNVCLAVEDSVQCVATYCETIVVVVNPNGNITGGVFESSNLTTNGGGEVSESFGGGGDPIPGLTVNLERADGTLITTDVTDALGQYNFNQLQFGDYRIRLVGTGITHDGKAITIDPVIQFKNGLDFEVKNDGSVTSSIDDNKWLSQFDLIPNPASDLVLIQVETSLSDKATLAIMNLTGKTVYSKPVRLNKNMQTFEVELSNLVSGVYFVVMQSANGIVTKKLVKH